MLSKEEQSIVDFIIEKKQYSDIGYKFVVEVYFEDGKILQVPFNVGLINGEWMVIITPDSLADDEFKVIDYGNISKQSTSSNFTIQSQVCSWNFSGRTYDSTFYSICEFDLDAGTDHKVLFNLQQWNSAPTQIEVPNIQYAVVDKGLFGDDVWGSTFANGNITPNPNQYYVTGKSQLFDNAQNTSINIPYLARIRDLGSD